MYAVFTSYYKYGEVDMEIISSDDDMRKYCIEHILEYHNDLQRRMEYYRARNLQPPTIDPICDISQLDSYILAELIEFTIECGDKTIEEQGGWGVRYIIRGNNLEQL